MLLALTLTTSALVGLIGLLWYRRRMRSNAAAAPRVTPEVAKANYDRFRQQAQQARTYLQQALERDEKGTGRFLCKK